MSLTQIFTNVQFASRTLGLLSSEKVNAVLLDLADESIKNISGILTENQRDLDRMDIDDPKYDRLKLTDKRIHDIASDIRNVAGLESPLDKVLLEKKLENGLKIKKIAVPIGVIGVIYEARPNVSFDVFSLCFKTGNACILKGGSDASYSNEAIIAVIHKVLEKHGINTDVVSLLPPERTATEALLNAVGLVDLIIPRGSQSLIDFVRNNAKVPVIETGAGIVHTYFDRSGNLQKGGEIVNNSKTRRVSVCNALDCLIIHEERLKDLPELTKLLINSEVEIFADAPAYKILEQSYPGNLLRPASNEHFGIEFLSHKMAIKTVKNLDEALAHIAEFSSKHSEAIISEDAESIEKFLNAVDAAAVYANASTAFTDGAQFGLGAEIGISTQKLHARGPMGLEELTSYKWVVRGDGQIRA